MHLRHEGMARVGRAEHLSRRRFEIPFVDLLDGHYRENLVLRVKQRDFAIEFDALVVRDRERDGNRKWPATRETHFLEHATVIFGAHEAFERAKSSGGEQFEIAYRAVRKVDSWQFFGAL